MQLQKSSSKPTNEIVLGRDVVIDQALDFQNADPFCFAALLQSKKDADQQFMPKRVKMQILLQKDAEIT